MSTIVVLTIFTFLAFVHHVAFSSRLRFAHLKVAIIIVGSRRGCCCCCWQGRVSEVVVGLFVLLVWRRWPFSLVDCQDSYEILCCIFVCLSLGPGAVIIRISSFAVASVAAIILGGKEKRNNNLELLHLAWSRQRTHNKNNVFWLWRNFFCPANFLNAGLIVLFVLFCCCSAFRSDEIKKTK